MLLRTDSRPSPLLSDSIPYPSLMFHFVLLRFYCLLRHLAILLIIIMTSPLTSPHNRTTLPANPLRHISWKTVTCRRLATRRKARFHRTLTISMEVGSVFCTFVLIFFAPKAALARQRLLMPTVGLPFLLCPNSLRTYLASSAPQSGQLSAAQPRRSDDRA